MHYMMVDSLQDSTTSLGRFGGDPGHSFKAYAVVLHYPSPFTPSPAVLPANTWIAWACCQNRWVSPLHFLLNDSHLVKWLIKYLTLCPASLKPFGLSINGAFRPIALSQKRAGRKMMATPRAGDVLFQQDSPTGCECHTHKLSTLWNCLMGVSVYLLISSWWPWIHCEYGVEYSPMPATSLMIFV